MGDMNQEVTINATAAARLKAQGEFICEHCGACCTGCTPIQLCETDLKRWVDYFEKSLKVIIRRHVKVYKEGRQQKIAIKKDLPCKFYIPGKGCRIYEARPEVCRTFPFLSGESMDSETFIVHESCLGALKVYNRMIQTGEIKGTEEKS